MKERKYLKRQQGFYLFLMISAYTSTLGFGTFYYVAGVNEIAIPTYGAFVLFVLLGVISFFTKPEKLVILFRLSISIASLAFFNQVFYSGGILSPAVFEFVIPPLLAFFYRPLKDRYIFMFLSFLCLLSFWILSRAGLTQNLVPTEYAISHAISCGIFVFLIVAIFTFLFRSAISHKNKQLGDSMKQLQDTTQKLVQSEKMASLGLLSAGVAHEINNPLNFIKGGLDILEMDLKKREELNPDIETSIHVIKEGLNRTSTIVNSLNHFSRQTDSMDEECDLHSILDNSLVMLQPKLKYKGTVKKNYAESSPVIQGNEGKLHQAFLNIIANSEQAIPENGTINIITIQEKNRVSVEVIDDGEGISPENLTKIRDPFFSTKPVGQGTGLGLAITYRIIEEHNGEIFVTSQVGKGTTFKVVFTLS